MVCVYVCVDPSLQLTNIYNIRIPSCCIYVHTHILYRCLYQICIHNIYMCVCEYTYIQREVCAKPCPGLLSYTQYNLLITMWSHMMQVRTTFSPMCASVMCFEKNILFI